MDLMFEYETSSQSFYKNQNCLNQDGEMLYFSVFIAIKSSSANLL